MKIFKIIIFVVLGIGLLVGAMFLVRNLTKIEESDTEEEQSTYSLVREELQDKELANPSIEEATNESKTESSDLQENNIKSDSKNTSSLTARNKLLAELKRIDTNQLSDSVANQAKEITKKHLANLSKTDERWSMRNILHEDPQTVKWIILKIKKGWDPFK